MAQAKQQATLGGLWEVATKQYQADLKRFDEEYEKKHSHVWNIHRHKKPSTEIPTMYSAKDFNTELEKKKAEFKDMRMKGHGVFKAMNNLATPVEIIGGQASAIGSMFMPATPMIFGAVMYLFNAGRDVHESYNVLEVLFTKCAEAIADISMVVNGVRYLKIELQNTVIEILTAILDVFRIATVFARSKRFKAYGNALANPGKGGPEKQALEHLKDLGKRQDRQVGIASLIGIDVLDQKHDKTDRKMDFVSSTQTTILSSQTTIINQVTQMKQMLKEKQEDKTGPKRTIDAKQRSEDKARNQLKKLLDPDVSVSDLAKELPATTAPGTCEWIFSEPEFEKWKTQPDVPILWVYGESGVGKSHLAAKIIEHAGPSHLMGAKETTRAEVAAYFIEYEDFDTPTMSGSKIDSTKNETTAAITPATTSTNGETDEKQVKADGKSETTTNPENAPKETKTTDDQDDDLHSEFVASILRTMAWQLSEDDKKYEKFLTDHIKATEENCKAGTPDIDVWKYLFNKYFTPPHDRFITFVIDGIDNMVDTQRRVFYRLIKHVVQAFKENGDGPIRFICLSQPTLKDEILKAFASHFEMPSITITKEKNLRDIETYISWIVDQSTKLRRALKDKTFRQETVKKLAGCTEGIFEMGALLLKQLAQKDHVDLFSEVLEMPPADIQCILRETLEHFGDTHTLHDIEDLNSLLAWVLYAYDSLTLAQLNAAIGIESEHGEFLDIRDKIGREFSAYFSIVDLRHKDTSSQPAKLPEETETIPLLSTSVDVPPEIVDVVNNDDIEVPTVKVAHASIAKFFRNSDTSNHACIGVTRDEAHLRLAKTCLRVICYKKEENSKSWKAMTTTEKLHTYAINSFCKHLKEAKSAATTADKVEMFRLLTKLFRDESVMAQFTKEVEFWPDFFDMESSLGTVWSWFSDEDVLSSLGDEEKQWVTEPCPSTAERILKPIAIWYAKNWLQDPAIGRNDEAMYFFTNLRSLINLFERSKEKISEQPVENDQPAEMKNESVDGEIPAANTTDTLAIAKGTPVVGEDVPLPSNEEKEETPIFGRHPFDEAWEEINGDGDAIRKVAEWAGFEKTALWCYRVGCCVSVLTRPITEDTLVDFKAALKMDPDFGAAHFRVATIYGELKQYDLAIKQMEEVKRVKYNESGGSLRRGAIWVAKWQEGKEDAPGTSEEAKTAGRQQAMKTLEAELEKSPEEFDLLAAYIEVAGKSGKHKAIMSKLLSLGAKLPEFVRSENVQENIGLHKTMRRAAQKTRRVGALKRAYEIAIEKDRLDKDMTEMPQRVYIHMDLIDSLANLYIENQEDDKALIQYQTLIDFADERDVSFYAYNGAMRIGLLHFLAACNKGSSEEERQEAIDALIKLEKEERDPDNNVISAAYTTHGLTLGLYYKLAGEPEKAHALFKDRIALAMTLLEDEDADNDWQGWENLTQTLFKDGDIENGRAAASMWYKEIKKIMGEPIDEEKTEGKDEDEKKKSNEGAAPDAETNGKTAPAATQIRDDPVINGPKGTADASLEKSKEPNDTEEPEPEISLNCEDTPWQTGTCDGICDLNLRDYDKGIYICIHCTGMWLCVECWEKHQESSLPYLLCDSDHQFAYVTGPPKNLCVEKGHETIWVGGKVRDMKEWLGEIWERWGVWKKGEEKEVKEVESGKVESGKVESGKVESGKVEG